MFKIVIGISIIALSCLIGKNFSKKHSERLKFYQSLNDFNSSLIRDISFKNDGLFLILNEKRESELFNNYSSSVLAAYKKGEELPLPPDIIPIEEGEKIKKYFVDAAIYGKKAERDYLLSKRVELSEKIAELKEKSVKISSIGSKLGFALGAALFIIII